MLSSRIKVRGTNFYEASASFRNGTLRKNSEVYLKHNPENQHDKNAVEVRLKLSDVMLGHVSKELAPKYATLSVSNAICKAYVSSADIENNYVDLRIIVIYRTDDYDNQEHEATYSVSQDVNLPNNAGVYALKNRLTGWMYVGSTKNIKYRIVSHIRELNAGKHVNKPLQTDYIKFGTGAFEAVVLVGNLESERLLSEEMAQIKSLIDQGINLYNMTEDGQGRVNSHSGLSSISERKHRLKTRNHIETKNVEEFTAILLAKAKEDDYKETKTLTLATLFRWVSGLFRK